ncbi:MAG: hypothetical protein LBT92_01970, partial [Rickettsiales bacterium]|nr:hypothetical protein [Rickettsiales bacterium]
MDEILRRIKRALAERDGEAPARREAPVQPQNAALSAASMREYARNPSVSRKILDGLVDDFAASGFS